MYLFFLVSICVMFDLYWFFDCFYIEDVVIDISLNIKDMLN